MRTKHEHISCAKRLAAHWRRLCKRAVSIARTMVRAGQTNPRRASEDAAMLEVWLQCALFTLIGQLGALNADGHVCAQEDANVQHLRAIAIALATLLMFVRAKRAAYEARLVDWFGFEFMANQACDNQPADRATSPPYIDPG